MTTATFDTVHVDHTDEGVALAGRIENDLLVVGARETVRDAVGSSALSAIEQVALLDWIDSLQKAVENAAARELAR
jgi:hypothetical protein